MPAYLGNHTVRWNVVVLNGGKGITGSFGSTGPFPYKQKRQQDQQQTHAQTWQQEQQQDQDPEHDRRTQPQPQVQDQEQEQRAQVVQPCDGCEVHRNYGGVISYNVIASNNFLGCNAYENGALKVHGFSGVVEGNLVVDNPFSAGMWFDDLWWNLRVSRNVVIATSNQSYTGIMLEISTGPAVVDNNVVITSGKDGAIFEADSNNVTIVQNLALQVKSNFQGHDVRDVGGAPDGFAALYLSGTASGRAYNIGVEPNPVHPAWLSYGCNLPPVNVTTNKNYWVEGNLFVATNGTPTHTICPHTNDGHVCCNNTIVNNALSSSGGGGGTSTTTNSTGNVASDMAAVFLGPINNSTHTYTPWNFTSKLVLRLKADDGPLIAGGARVHTAGASVDFFGNVRSAAPKAGRVAQAGPFENVAGKETEFQLWPPPQ